MLSGGLLNSNTLKITEQDLLRFVGRRVKHGETIVTNCLADGYFVVKITA